MVPLGRMLGLALVTGAALLACSSKSEGTVRVVVGDEADALTRAPAPTTLVVASIDLSLNVKELSRTSLPASQIDLGDVSKMDVGALRVTGLLADGTTVVKGETLYVEWGALAVTELPVFVQRTGEMARLPDAPTGPIELATVQNGRYVLETSGTTATVYDLLLLRTSANLPSLPRPPKSILSYGSVVVTIDDTSATSLDLNDGSSNGLPSPQGGTLAEVAGGLTVLAPDGSSFVVGATRATGAPTPRVLQLGNGGDLAFTTLSAPRLGACATWVAGRGLAVWGGSATASGGEVIAVGTAAGAPLAYAGDAVTGCGLAALDAGRVLVAGGVMPDGSVGKVREIDLACAGNCAPKPWAGDVPVVRASVVGLGPNAALVVGDDASGATRAFRVTPTEAKEVPLKTPRRGAKVLASPTGTVLIAGGGGGIEQYAE